MTEKLLFFWNAICFFGSSKGRIARSGEGLQMCTQLTHVFFFFFLIGAHSRSQTVTKTFANNFNALKQFFLPQRTFEHDHKFDSGMKSSLQSLKSVW